MGRRTPLYEQHLRAGAKMVDFGGWDMPLHYGSQLAEHHQVRRAAGLFDVSHMRTVEIKGARARPFLRYLLANDVDKLKMAGKALYGCLLNEEGGVLDDLITYFLTDDWFRIVVNAGPGEEDIAWFRRHAPAFGVDVIPRPELAMIAVQGPEAFARAGTVLGAQTLEMVTGLKPFQAAFAGDLFLARTGYTGEEGFEVIAPADRVVSLWESFVAAGVPPAGLGARDTLRLEAGMNLYGHDMDTTVTPWESGLGWTVALSEGRDFIGRAALERQLAASPARKQVGLLLLGPGVLRSGQRAHCVHGEGVLTSGSFSPTLERGIALARVPSAVVTGEECDVEMRPGRIARARIVSIPFVRNGRILVDL